MPPKRILVLDDEKIVLDVVRRFLSKTPYAFMMAESISQARSLLELDPAYSLLIVDLRLPDGGGDDFIMEFQDRNPLGKVLVVSGHLRLARDMTVLKAHGWGCLLKPFNQKDFLRMVKALMGEDVPAGPGRSRAKEGRGGCP